MKQQKPWVFSIAVYREGDYSYHESKSVLTPQQARDIIDKYSEKNEETKGNNSMGILKRTLIVLLAPFAFITMLASLFLVCFACYFIFLPFFYIFYGKSLRYTEKYSAKMYVKIYDFFNNMLKLGEE